MSLVKGFTNFVNNNQIWLSTFGLIFIFYLIFKLVWIIWLNFKAYVLSPTLHLNSKYLEKGTWAVVTGSTDGIGKEYAIQLAGKGLNIVLISRTLAKLNDVAKIIDEKYPSVQVKCVVADFSEGLAIYQNIEKELHGLDISLLVNNVGVSNEKPSYLAETKDDEIEKMITVNCLSVVYMTKMALNGMLDRKKGTIINIASQAALYPVPFLSVYSATKAFVKMFTNAMIGEYGCKDITFQCVSPGLVVTKMSKVRRSNFFAPNPDTYVKSAIDTIGVQSNTAGCFAHSIMETFTLALPDSILLCLVAKNMKGVRAKALARNPKKE